MKRHNFRMTVVDISEGMLEKTRKRAEAEGVSDRIDFQVADIHNLPFKDNSFDVVIIESLLVFTDKERSLSESKRVAKPGGVIATQEFTWQHPPTNHVVQGTEEVLCQGMRFLQMNEWVDLFKKAGLSNIDAEEGPFIMMYPAQMVRDEGMLGLCRMMMRSMSTWSRMRRMFRIYKFMLLNMKYYGYGIYAGTKPA